MRLYVGAEDSHKVLFNELDNLPPARRAEVVAKQRRIIGAVEALVREIRPDAGGLSLPLTMLFFGMINWTHTWFRPGGAVDADRLADMAVGSDAERRSGVVIELDAVALGHGLAGEHVARRHLLVGEAVARRHFHLARHDPGAAGRADAGLAGEGRGQARRAGAVEDVAGRGVEGDPALAAVERDHHGQARGFLGQRLHLRLERGRGPAGGEALEMDAILGDAFVDQRRFGGVHHRAGAADEEGGHVRRIDQGRQYLIAFGAIEHAVEQVELLGFFGKEMMDLQPVHETIFQAGQRLEEDDRVCCRDCRRKG